MTDLRVDHELDLPQPPERIPALGSHTAELALAGPAADARYFVEGERAAATGPQRGPLDRIVIGAKTVAGALETNGVPVNVVLAPGLARRELVGPGGTLLETLVVAPTLPLVAVQWASPARPTRLTLALTVLPGRQQVRYRVGGACVAFAEGDADETVAVSLSPPPSTWRVTGLESGGARLTAEVEATHTTTLLVAAGPAAAVRGALAASAHLGAHARRAAEGAAEGLVLSTGTSDLDEAMLWARARLRTSLARTPEPEVRDPNVREDVFWAGIGAAAIGDGCGAARALELLESGPDDPRAALLAARVALAFGDQGPATSQASFLLESGRAPTSGGGASMRSLALESLADALGHAAPESTIAELRRAAAALAGPDREGKRLPVVGGAGPPSTFAAWLGRALQGEASEEGRRRSGHASTDAALAAWAAFRGDSDVAWTAWAIHLRRGLSAGAAGPGTWEPVTAHLRAPARTVGALLGALAHGFLRLAPDAPVGRLRLGPCVPSGLRRLRADGIALGESRLRLDYEREGACHRFTLDATAGRVPPTVVFDPIVRGRATSARVDGAPADLERIPEGPSTRVPVQLSVDASRTVEIFVE